MNDRNNNNNNCCDNGFKEAVCIHTDKVYDSCRDKDCLENIRVYLTASGQSVVDRAINVKCTKAEIIWVFSDIEAVPFNRGFYSVDLKYFFRVTLAVFTGIGRPTEVEGLATFNKKVILFGSEGNAKVFASKYKEDAFDPQLWRKTNMPNAVVEVVDPIALGAKVVDIKRNRPLRLPHPETPAVPRQSPANSPCLQLPATTSPDGPVPQSKD